MTKVLVTGGAGFIGSHLVDYLIDELKLDVVVLDNLSGGSTKNLNPEAEFINGDIRDPVACKRAVKGCAVVYHLAAYAAEGLSHFRKKFIWDNNMVGSINVLNAAVNENVKVFVFTSSMAAYGNQKAPFSEDMPCTPEDTYGLAKFAFEKELELTKRLYGMQYVIIRPHNVIGIRQNKKDPARNVLAIWSNMILNNKAPLIYGDGKQTRAFSYVGDIVPCVAKAPFLRHALSQIINVGYSKPHTLNELAKTLKNASGTNLNWKHTSDRPLEVKHAYCTTHKAKRLLNFKETTTIKQAVKEYWDWAKKEGPSKPVYWGKAEINKNLPDVWKKREI